MFYVKLYVHSFVDKLKWHSVRFMGSHITLILFVLQAHYSEFCKDGLMTVNWPKHVSVKPETILFSSRMSRIFQIFVANTKGREFPRRYFS